MATLNWDFEPWVDAGRVAEFLSIERKTVLAWARRGKLPATPLDPDAGRKEWRFKLSEVDEAMRARVNSDRRLSPVLVRKKQ
jgi:excisionase family DNA binding protein